MTDTKRFALVTGATGWLGMGLVGALVNGLADYPNLAATQKKLTIRCLVPPGQNTAELRSISDSLEIVEGDVTKPESLARFFTDVRESVLYHCAGVIHPKRVRDFYAINTQGTANVYAKAASAKVRRAVIISSNSPCGNNPHPDHLFDEKSPYNPYMAYGYSKMLMEQSVWKLHGRGNAPETVIIRAPWFYGPFQPARQTEFFGMIRNGKGPLIGSGINRRSMVYIDNLAQGLLLAASVAGIDGETYWIADAQTYSMAEILDTIESVLRDDFSIPCKGTRLKLPSIAAYIAQGIDYALQKTGIYNQKIHVLSEMNKTIACSVEKAVNELGYRPAVSLREGIRRSVTWLLDQPEGKNRLFR